MMHTHGSHRRDHVADGARVLLTAERGLQATTRSTSITGVRLRGIATALVFLGLSVVFVLVPAHRSKVLGPYDELTHADYAYQVSHGHLPYAGSHLSLEMRAEYLCHNSGITTFPLPECGGATQPPGAYDARGENYNFDHPPVYYFVTGWLARGWQQIVPGDDFLTAARSIGALWLFAAMGILYLALRRLRVGVPYAFFAAALLPTVPVIINASYTVSNDSTAALCGSMALLLLGRLTVQRRLGWFVPTAMAAFCTGTKVLNGLPFLVIAGLLLWQAREARRAGARDRSRQMLVVAVTMTLAFLAVYGGWELIQDARATPGWVSPIAGLSGRPTLGLPFDELLSTSFTGFGIVSDVYLPTTLSNDGTLVWARLLTALVLAAPLLVVVMSGRGSSRRTVALWAAIGVIVYPLAVELKVFVGSGDYFPVVATRYGLTFVPGLIACLALVAHQRRLLRTSVLVTLGGLALMVCSIAGA